MTRLLQEANAMETFRKPLHQYSLCLQILTVLVSREKVGNKLVAEIRHILLDPVTVVRNMPREREERDTHHLLATELSLSLTSLSHQNRWCHASLPSPSAAHNHHLPVQDRPRLHSHK